MIFENKFCFFFKYEKDFEIVRFSFSKSRSAPGPGQYRICGFAEENLKKAIIDSNRKPAFGQSSERKFSIAKKDGSSMPGPENYKIVERPFKLRNENFSSNFASTSKQRDIIFEVAFIYILKFILSRTN